MLPARLSLTTRAATTRPSWSCSRASLATLPLGSSPPSWGVAVSPHAPHCCLSASILRALCLLLSCAIRLWRRLFLLFTFCECGHVGSSSMMLVSCSRIFLTLLRCHNSIHLSFIPQCYAVTAVTSSLLLYHHATQRLLCSDCSYAGTVPDDSCWVAKNRNAKSCSV